jgi:hypothetical protein
MAIFARNLIISSNIFVAPIMGIKLTTRLAAADPHQQVLALDPRNLGEAVLEGRDAHHAFADFMQQGGRQTKFERRIGQPALPQESGPS